MARHFQMIDEWETWIPDVGNEREIYKVDPDNALTMELRHLTKEQVQQYTNAARRYVLSGDETAAKTNIDGMIQNHVRNITGYSIDGVAIVTGIDLCERGEEVIKSEAIKALLSRSSLDEGLAKKLNPRCASTHSQAQTKKRGDAADATKQSPQGSSGILTLETPN